MPNISETVQGYRGTNVLFTQERAAGSPGPLTWMGGNIAQSTTYTYDISTGHIKLPNSLLARVTV